MSSQSQLNSWATAESSVCARLDPTVRGTPDLRRQIPPQPALGRRWHSILKVSFRCQSFPSIRSSGGHLSHGLSELRRVQFQHCRHAEFQPGPPVSVGPLNRHYRGSRLSGGGGNQIAFEVSVQPGALESATRETGPRRELSGRQTTAEAGIRRSEKYPAAKPSLPFV